MITKCSFFTLAFYLCVRTAAAVPASFDVKVLLQPEVESPKSIASILPLLYLERWKPEQVKLDLYFAVITDERGVIINPKVPDRLELTAEFLYVRKHYPRQFLDYYNCSQTDFTRATCGPLLGIDLSRWKADLPQLRAELLEQGRFFRQAKILAMPYIEINGKPYEHSLQLPDLASALGLAAAPPLPPQSEAAAPASPEVSLYAIGRPNGVGARDPVWESHLAKQFPNLRIVATPDGSGKGRRLLRATGAQALPAYVFGPELSKFEPLFNAMSRSKVIDAKGGYYLVRPRSGQSLLYLDRPAKPGELTLFVMSHCPYGARAETAVIDSWRRKKMPKVAAIKIRFIVNEDSDAPSGYRSLHGNSEVNEDLRQLVIQKLYPEKFFDYLSAKNKDYADCEWEEAAAKAGLDAQAVKAHIGEGKALLADDLRQTQALGVNASPTYLWENRYLTYTLPELGAMIGADFGSQSNEDKSNADGSGKGLF